MVQRCSEIFETIKANVKASNIKASNIKGADSNDTYLAIQAGLSEMQPNTQALAITTGLHTRSPAPILNYEFPLYTAAQLYTEL